MSPRDPSLAPYLTVKHLLALVGALLTVTFGFFTWEANRAITKLDDVAKTVNVGVTNDAVQGASIASLDKRVDGVETTVTDQGKRISALEAVQAHTPR